MGVTSMPTKNKRMQVTPWTLTLKHIEEKAKELGCSAGAYAGHVLNQNYLESLKATD